MYVQPLFAMTDAQELQQVLCDYPLATLVAQTPSGLEINLLPLLWLSAGRHGRLAGHVSRSHPLAAAANEACEVTAIFQSPNAYISPQWYVNGQRSGRNAPSWNYLAVQAQGRLRSMDDPQWMREHLEALTHAQESRRAQPWTTAQADPEFLGAAATRLVGFEIDILDLRGKRFLSQQRTEADRLSLIQHLDRDESTSSRAVARLIQP